MKSIEIKKVKANQISQLQEIGIQTFAETFSVHNSKENMRDYLNENFSSAKLTGELSNKGSEFYFAVLGGDVIGYLKINFDDSQTEIKDENTLEIERIYVLKEFHGKKVGQVLYGKAMEIARERGVDYVWLGVWEENPRAMRFYKKNGFVEFDRHIFRLGDDEQTDILMKLQMKEK